MDPDPDYIDPEILRSRARAKGNRPEDVTVGRRPRVRRATEPGHGLKVVGERSTFVAGAAGVGISVTERDTTLAGNRIA